MTMNPSTDLATSAPQAAIGQEEFLKFREFFYRKTGILFEDSKRYFVDRRLLERIQATGSGDFRTYFALVRFQASGQELQFLINAMTVNETYFFREEYQFKCLVNSLLNEVVTRKKPGENIRIWSIPCSSGEEPYSLALYLLEHWPGVERYDVELHASDIDTAIVAKAQAGLFPKRSVQPLPQRLLEQYFTRERDNYRICRDLRESVEFSVMNLNDPAQTRHYRDFDVIFCRNLLIYFDDVSRRQAAETFFDALNPGGFICLGHSESMSRISSLYRVRKFPDGIVYQKAVAT